ncbi:RICIN domain-containing protein [Adhaeribacter radiodurans]|uniref:RICIN domain-containing protein n=1 Tax=Adhaeribacter radiodurans TaxID=2745197 RepID=A0A7L7L8E5_9BACT|nr:RICIN domain-containing protein [Adhaeribacter radiodurans]QMU29091.1 RICIN domain-containing protein [Adhaeribacter radiodurans]
MKTILLTLYLKTSGILFLLLLPFAALSQIEQGLYTIKLVSANSVLNAKRADMDKDGCIVHTWTYLEGANQHWKIVPSSVEGSYNIRVAGTGKALDAAWNERFTNGGRIILWSFNDGESQRWRLEKISDNRYRIRLAVSRKLLSGTGTIDGSRVQLWSNLGNNTQEWIIEKVSKITISEKYVDLRPNQTGIQNQGGRGSCTYFGATAALEAAYKKAGYGNVNLSEEFFSMQGKALYLHPTWSDTERKGPDVMENQFAGTQGGGSVFIFSNGFAVPDSSYVPYHPTDYPWDTISQNGSGFYTQKSANNFNFSLNNNNVLKAPRYYSANSMAKLSNYKDVAEYEQLLRQGFEINFNVLMIGSDGHPDNIWRPACDPNTDSNCRPGAHNMLIVGFDKTDPDPKNYYLIVKNSWGHSRIPGSDGFTYMHYDYLKYALSAEYIKNVNPPKKWPELGLLGEYSLDFDGWKGRLDIYHLPGINQWGFDFWGVNVPDRRLGIFYDQYGNAFRVNGSVRKITNELLEVTFFINNAKPNPRWDELEGRKFIYYYDYRKDFMAGFHTDPGGTNQYAGYAVKARNRFITNSARTPRPFRPASYKNSSWNLDISSGPKGKLYLSQSGSNLFGSFYNNATRSLSDVQVRFTNSSFTQMEFRLEGYTLKGQHLTWENGLIAGYDVISSKPFYMVRQRPQVPDLTWNQIGSPLSGQSTDICACNDGSLFVLKSDKSLYKSTAGGGYGSWNFVTNLPANTRQIACARNLVYFQVVGTLSTGELWFLDGVTPRRSAALSNGGILAGTEDNTLDFSYLYYLNSAKDLLRSSTSGVTWTKIGHPGNAAKIAVTQNVLFTLQNDGSFWINRYGGSDVNWVKIDALPEAKDITATSLGQTGKADLYYLHQDGSLWRTTVVDKTLGYNNRMAIAEPTNESSELIKSRLQISPNPASEILTLGYKGQNKEIITLQVSDISGKIMKKYKAEGDLNEQVNISGWSKGVYVVTLMYSQGIISKRLLIR